MTYVLVIEDEDILLELLETVLADEGHEVRGTTDAARALEMVAVEQPSVIVFDMTLPDISGAEFVQRYRCLPDATATLIAVSGIANLEDEATRIGADGCLTKPFELDDLIHLVNRALT